jgi:hypothetical protein
LKLIDANLLIYAHNVNAPEHQLARTWMEATLSQPDPVGLAWLAILAFLRILTDSRLFAHPRSMTDATAMVTSWLARPNVSILSPTTRHWTVLTELFEKGQVRGPLVGDAHLAALAIEHGATLSTTDRDFARFPRLTWMNPLE